jgi:hypothetical protein
MASQWPHGGKGAWLWCWPDQMVATIMSLASQLRKQGLVHNQSHDKGLWVLTSELWASRSMVSHHAMPYS